MAGMGRAELLGELQRFKEALSANVDELQPYEGSRLRFGELVTQAQALTHQQAALTASKQASSRQIETTLDEASRLATVLRFAVKEHYGADSEKLVEFGLQPFRGRTKKSKPTLPEAPAPAEPSPAD